MVTLPGKDESEIDLRALYRGVEGKLPAYARWVSRPSHKTSVFFKKKYLFL